jgi:hypothetical protein
MGRETQYAPKISTGGNKGGDDGGGCDAAETDKKDADDEDEDGCAPSDTVITLGGNQAGHKCEDGATPMVGGQKRKISHEETSTTTEVPKVKRTRKAQDIEDSSDADDYAGVDLISDSEEVDLGVETLEERLIIASEEDMAVDSKVPLTILPDGWAGFDYDDEPLFSDIPYFDEDFGRTDPLSLPNEVELYDSNGILHDNTKPPRATEGGRRVRFAEPVSLPHEASGDDVSESSQDIGSNPFRWKDEWSTTLRGRIDEGKNNQRGFTPNNGRKSRVGSKPRETCRARSDSCSERSASSCGSLSGYESKTEYCEANADQLTLHVSADLGETTEEDETPPYQPQSVRRPPQAAQRHERSLAPMPANRSGQKGHRPGPPMGSWIADPTKPIALVDKSGTSLIIFRAQKAKTNRTVASSSSTANTSPRMSRPSFSSDIGNSPDCTERDRSDLSSHDYAVHYARSNKPKVIMPLLLHSNPGISSYRHRLVEHDTEPPAHLLPIADLHPDVLFNQFDEYDENEGDIPLDINDFVDFGDDSEESEDDKEYSTATKTHQSPPKLGKAHSTPMGVQSPPNLLDHLGKGVVTAFRRDQNRHATLAPLRLEDDILDPFGFAMEQGMYASAHTSMSPTVSRAMSPEIGPPMSPVQSFRMSELPSLEESVRQAKAALAAML